MSETTKRRTTAAKPRAVTVTQDSAAQKADAYYARLKSPRMTEGAVANVVGEIGRILNDPRNAGDSPLLPAATLARLREVSAWVNSDVRKAVRKAGNDAAKKTSKVA